MNDALGERIKAIRNKLSLTQSQFGEKIGVSRDVINNLEHARAQKVSEPLLKLICKTYNVNYTWLIDGVEPMFFPETDDDLTIRIAKILEGENETAKKIFQAFSAFGEDDWKTVQKFIDELKR